MVALLVLGFDLDFELAEAGVEGSVVLGVELPVEVVAAAAAELVAASGAAVAIDVVAEGRHFS